MCIRGAAQPGFSNGNRHSCVYTLLAYIGTRRNVHGLSKPILVTDFIKPIVPNRSDLYARPKEERGKVGERILFFFSPRKLSGDPSDRFTVADMCVIVEISHR